jgi:hypothetical protein
VLGCAGSTGCSVQMTDANCGTDPCYGTAKSGSITITCD